MSTVVDIEKIVRGRCFAVLDSGDSFCRHCGAPTCIPDDLAVPVAERAPDRVMPRSALLENRWAVLAMLFLVLGPLGLPMLWRSRQFSPLWKIVLTALVLGLTAALMAMIWYVLARALEPLTELRKAKGF